jgi:hypothetical protein
MYTFFWATLYIIPQSGKWQEKSDKFHTCTDLQIILLNNQRDAALSSRIYSSLQGLLYVFRVLSAPIIRSTIKTADAFIGTVHAINYKSIV